MMAPQLIVCMGLSGTGKTTLARSLSRELEWPCIEAEDFHSARARQRLAQGITLDDQERVPWMAAITRHLESLFSDGLSCVLAHTGLLRENRDQLRSGQHDTHFLELAGPQPLLEQRMAHRAGPFVPPSLLSNQLNILQPTDNESDVYRLDISRPVDFLVRDSLTALEPFLARTAEA